MIAGTLMQTLILLWVTFRTDWNKEVTILTELKFVPEENISYSMLYLPNMIYLLLYFIRRIKGWLMNIQVESARKRLDKWEDTKKPLLED